MTIIEAKTAVCAIRDRQWDDEAAHSAEDTLYHNFVRYVAELGDDEVSRIAKVILETEDIGFARWCA